MPNKNTPKEYSLLGFETVTITENTHGHILLLQTDGFSEEHFIHFPKTYAKEICAQIMKASK